MNYTNRECTTPKVDAKKCDGVESNPSLTEKVKEIREIAIDLHTVACWLYASMFGQQKKADYEEKEGICLDEDIENIGRILLSSVNVLNEAYRKIGCQGDTEYVL